MRSKKPSNNVKNEEFYENCTVQTKKNVSPKLSLTNFQKFKKKKTKFKSNLIGFHTVRDPIDPKVKFQKYEEKRRDFLEVMQNNFRKKLDKNNMIRLNAEKKK